jgi:hypothetical protein
VATHAVARAAIAAVWIYQGLIPKLLFRHTGELALLRGSGLFPGREEAVLTAMGIGEILFGLILIAFWRARSLLLLQVPLLIGLTAGALRGAPATFLAPYNPATLNLALAALALVGFRAAADSPSARRGGDHRGARN